MQDPYRLTIHQRGALATLARRGPTPRAMLSRRTVNSLLERGLVADTGDDEARIDLTELGRRVMPLLAVEEAVREEVLNVTLAKYGARGMTTASGVCAALGGSGANPELYKPVANALDVLELEGKVKGYTLIQPRFSVPSEGAELMYGAREVRVRDAYWLDWTGEREAVEAHA